MPIMSVGEVKTYLGVTASTHDAIISLLIPEVQQRLTEICNTAFESGVYISGSFTWNTSSNAIVQSAGNFLGQGFANGDDIYVSGSYRNDGYHEVLTAGTTSVTIVSSTTIVDELSGASVIVTGVKWPTGIKAAFSALVKYDYSVRMNQMGVQSESVGDYSVSYGTPGIYGYPDELIRGLAYWQRPRFG